MMHGRSLRVRLTGVLLAMVLVIFAFGVVIVAVFERRNQELLYNALHESIAVYARSIERELLSVERLSIDVMSDQFVQQYLIELTTATGFDWQQLSSQLSRRFALHTRLPYVQAIIGIDRTGRLTVSRSDFPPLASMVGQSVLDAFRMSGLSTQWVVTGAHDDRLYLFRRVREIEDFRLADLGTLAIVVEKRRLSRSAVSTPFREAMQVGVYSAGELVFVDGEVARQVMTGGAAAGSGYRLVRVDGQPFFYSGVDDPDRGLTYAFLVPYGLVFSGISRFNGVLAVFAAALLVAFLLISVWTAREIAAPIIELAGRMRQVEEADFRTIDLGIHSYERPDEIGVLYREFGVMLRRIDSLITENYRAQLSMKDTQFRSLQAQINPHFLYNTLESINWAAQLRDQDDIAGMVQALGTLLRASIDTRRPAVTVAEEIGFLEQYLVIQKNRYGDRFRVTIDVPDECRAYGIPALTLQPLVENAIKYGVERRTGGGRRTAADHRPLSIAVRGELGPQTIRLTVRDDGPGMTGEFVTALLSGTVEPTGSGVGVKNIIDRLRALFADEGKLHIESQPMRGAAVTIELPKISDTELGRRMAELAGSADRVEVGAHHGETQTRAAR